MTKQEELKKLEDLMYYGKIAIGTLARILIIASLLAIIGIHELTPFLLACLTTVLGILVKGIDLRHQITSLRDSISKEESCIRSS